jgi:hypothetical protein
MSFFTGTIQPPDFDPFKKSIPSIPLIEGGLATPTLALPPLWKGLGEGAEHPLAYFVRFRVNQVHEEPPRN